MEAVKTSILLLIACAALPGVARADLVWTSAPVVLGTGGFHDILQATPTATGLVINASCVSVMGPCGGSVDVRRNYTITSTGQFTFSGDFQNTTLSGNQSYAPMVSLTADYQVNGLPLVQNQVSNPGNIAQWISTGNFSSTVMLAPGDYMLEEAYSAHAQGTGSVYINFSGTFSVVDPPSLDAAPEPTLYGMVAAMLLLIVMFQRRRESTRG